jgi:hypothetical protein
MAVATVGSNPIVPRGYCLGQLARDVGFGYRRCLWHLKLGTVSMRTGDEFSTWRLVTDPTVKGRYVKPARWRCISVPLDRHQPGGSVCDGRGRRADHDSSCS